jgi:hypothetical protein
VPGVGQITQRSSPGVKDTINKVSKSSFCATLLGQHAIDTFWCSQFISFPFISRNEMTFNSFHEMK